VIRVLLADDQALIRAGFRVLLDSAQDIEVIGEAQDGAQAVELALRRRADVVLMDIRMPGVDGLEATRRIEADGRLAGVKVLILTTFESDEYVYEALQAGASGFWSRTPSRPSCCARSASSPTETRSSRRRSPAD
jgi:DNA-binding NarL/FixJ family response regulator